MTTSTRIDSLLADIRALAVMFQETPDEIEEIAKWFAQASDRSDDLTEAMFYTAIGAAGLLEPVEQPMTVAQACKEVGISRSMLYRTVRAGESVDASPEDKDFALAYRALMERRK